MPFLLIGVFLIGIALGVYQGIKEIVDKSRADKEAKAEYNRWINRHNGYDGIHLSEDQIRDLDDEIQLPCLPPTSVPIVLSSGETAVYHTDAEIVKDYYFPGELVITTKRVVFVSDEKGFDLQNSKISSFLHTSDGITIQSGQRIYKLELDAPYLAKTAFDGVVNKNIPLSSGVMRDSTYINDRMYSDTESSIDHMEGHEFEYFCAELLQKNGYTNVEVTRGSGDQGVDVLAVNNGVHYAIQCKNYATPLSNTPVQEVNAGKIFYGCHVGVVMTNSSFTPGAIALAEATGVLLWDRSKIEWLIENSNKPAQETGIQDHSPVRQMCPSQRNHITHSKELNDGPQQDEINGISIEVDLQSTRQVGIILNNFGIEKDDDDEIEFLFDVFAKVHQTIQTDIDIVCNLYSGRRKLATEIECIYRDSFRKKDSCVVYFSKRNIGKISTRIEVYCKKS